MNRASFIKAMGAVFLAPTAAARLAGAWEEPGVPVVHLRSYTTELITPKSCITTKSHRLRRPCGEQS